jgi:hypothetical protein
MISSNVSMYQMNHPGIETLRSLKICRATPPWRFFEYSFSSSIWCVSPLGNTPKQAFGRNPIFVHVCPKLRVGIANPPDSTGLALVAQNYPEWQLKTAGLQPCP